MTEQELKVIDDFRRTHDGERGAMVLADQLMELGFMSRTTNEEQVTLRNYAIRVIEKMGALTAGQKYQLCLSIAKLLQGRITGE